MAAQLPEAQKINKLIIKLIIKAAKNDKEAVFAIAKEIQRIFEESLEEERSVS